MSNYREITISGDLLEDDRVPDSAKILYGKIARLSYKEDHCWTSKEILIKSPSIKIPKNCGYIRTIEDRIYICNIANKQGNEM